MSRAKTTVADALARVSAEHRRALDEFAASGGPEQAAAAGALLVETLLSGGKILICGNGGSAADAQHLAAEIVGRFVGKSRRALPAIALTTDSSILTSVANDFGYERVFARQVEAFGARGDLLVGISTSGSSRNVLEAFRAAAPLGMGRIALVGKSAEGCAELVDVAVRVPHGETARIQELHLMIYHAWCEAVDAAFSG
ncbi:MAG: SIS domain-containing protein [Candidatus Sumerlaeia bacterium]|nr:SIS domain-containing protein [Candidatus Sumerlaeia bacterium]